MWERDSLRTRTPGDNTFADVRQSRKELLICKKIRDQRLRRFTQKNCRQLWTARPLHGNRQAVPGKRPHTTGCCNAIPANKNCVIHSETPGTSSSRPRCYAQAVSGPCETHS